MKTKNINIRIPDELHAALKRKSVEADMPMNIVIRAALSDFCKNGSIADVFVRHSDACLAPENEGDDEV